MELQLALALPNHLSKGFDLNTSKEMGHEIWSNGHRFDGRKRDFHEAFDPACGSIMTQSLFWTDQPRDDDNDDNDDNDDMGLKNDIKKSIVGWPPIKESRKLQFGGGIKVERDETKGGYVKVKMEGVAVGRKIDLTVHHSYQTLTQTLNNMFGIYENGATKDGAKHPRYKLTYQDKEGDWMLAGDVPWSIFVKIAQRLKIQKSKN